MSRYRSFLLFLAVSSFLLGTLDKAVAFVGGPGKSVISGRFSSAKGSIVSDDVTSRSGGNGLTYLIAVIQNKRLDTEQKKELINIILGKGADIEDMDSVGNSPLMHAVKIKDAELVRYLIEKNAEADVTNLHGETPLSTAIKMGRPDLAEILRTAGADTDTINTRGKRPIEDAAAKGDRKMIDYLVAQQPSILRETPGALVAAAGSGNTDLVRYIIEEHGVNVNSHDADGITALHTAAGNGHVTTLKYLLGKGARINTPGLTPLMVAASVGRDDAVHFLVERGADINAQTKKENTALYQAVANYQFKTAAYLIQSGARFPEVDKKKESLNYAVLKYLFGTENARKGDRRASLEILAVSERYMQMARTEAKKILDDFEHKRKRRARNMMMLQALGEVAGGIQAQMQAKQTSQIVALGQASNMGTGPAGYFRNYNALSRNIKPVTGTVPVSTKQGRGAVSEKEEIAFRQYRLSKFYLDQIGIYKSCMNESSDDTTWRMCINSTR